MISDKLRNGLTFLYNFFLTEDIFNVTTGSLSFKMATAVPQVSMSSCSPVEETGEESVVLLESSPSSRIPVVGESELSTPGCLLAASTCAPSLTLFMLLTLLMFASSSQVA